jgi:hypothetical protein
MPTLIERLRWWGDKQKVPKQLVDMRDACREAAARLAEIEDGGTPPPQAHVASDLLTTVKEFAHWHHLNEVTIAAGNKPSDSEIDLEAIAWNRITRALAASAMEARQ